MASGDRHDRQKKIQEKIKVFSAGLPGAMPSTAHVPALAHLTTAVLASMSEPDLIDLERKLGGRVTQ